MNDRPAEYRKDMPELTGEYWIVATVHGRYPFPTEKAAKIFAAAHAGVIVS